MDDKNLESQSLKGEKANDSDNGAQGQTAGDEELDELLNSKHIVLF